MIDFYDAYDDLIVDDDPYGITVDVPSAALSGLSDIYGAIGPAWDTDAMQAATASLSNALRGISDCIQPAMTSCLCSEEAISSISSSMGRIAESIKPLATSCALEGATAAVEQLRDAVALSPAVTEALACTASENLSTIAERVHDSVNIDPTIATALSSTLQSSIAETVKPLVTSCAMDNLSTLVRCASEEMEFKTSIVDSAVRAANAALQESRPLLEDTCSPIHTMLTAIEERYITSFDLSMISSALSKACDFSHNIVDLFCGVSGLLDGLRESIIGISEYMYALLEDAYYGFRSFSHLLFHLLFSIWESRPRRHMLPGEVAVMRAAALIRIDLAPPIRIREFAVRIRQSYLQKHQRIGDDSEDMNDSFLRIFATT